MFNDKSKARWGSLAALALVTGAILSGCGATDGSAGKDGSAGANVAFVPKAVNVPYFDVAASGARKAAKELGGKFTMVGPADAKAASQVPFINQLQQKQVSVIAVSANDPNALVPALNQAKDAGSKTMTWDSDVATAARDVYVEDVSSEAEAANQLDMLGRQMGYEGEFAILSSTPTASAQNDWIAAMKVLLKTSKYARMKLVKIAYGGEDAQNQFRTAQGLIQAYPSVKGITGISSLGPAAVAQAVAQAGKKGAIAATGVALPSSVRKYVKDGTIKEVSLWDLPKLGYLTYYAAAALGSGKITGKPGETFKAGDMGTQKVGKDGVIVLGPPLIYTAKNIDKYDY